MYVIKYIIVECDDNVTLANSVARLRALTHESMEKLKYIDGNVEMKVARLRALTHSLLIPLATLVTIWCVLEERTVQASQWS